ncbi:ribonuclease E/G [Rhizobium sp. NRK18]|uniref:Rne/Rng family ribonuclease n=1 Tax=Rhizobium sp. NRK18 TaxID=2964667 RepID=UPI0021C4C26F|nr:ribonuclease E/G [Rhizobium sp. NRK18]MCQ2004498.1 ribonuclease E/G [Rhizobium sp. NRK18]
MADKMLIDASHEEETRVVVVRGNRIEEFDFESQHKKQLRGNIYLAKVTRVEPSLQAAFVDYGGNRHGFLAFSEIHPDYYQIPLADRQALLRDDEADDDHDDDTGSDHDTAETPAAVVAEAVATSEATSSEKIEAEAAEAPAEAEAAAATEEEPKKAKKPRRSRAKPKKAKADEEAAAEDSGEAASAGEDGEGNGDEMAAMVDTDTISEEVDTDGDDDDDDDDHPHEKEEIESIGAEDAMEELPERRSSRRPRKQYRIQEVIKRRQILLVQVAKEERGNKGAALTTYLSLAGRYSVLMPNTGRGGGISRKITNPADRKRLKEITRGLEVPKGMGVILRTAGANRTKAEVKRDFEYLMRLWENVRTLTLNSTAPCLVYEEGSLIKRSIRDLYNKDINEIIVAGEEGYKEAKSFMRMLMPSHAKVVQPYRDLHPIFSRSGIEAQLDRMLQPQVTLKSGGYIIINQTEALVAIDVNSGRSTREHSIEDTALQTNLEAAEEVARQLRLRDLAGLIVVDFIDMEEKRNNRSVEKRLKDCLKNDRARIQVGRISHFGLLEMSRQRIRASVLESTTQVCSHCGGTGHVRSQSSIALHVLRGIEEYLLKNTTHNITVHTTPDIALYLLNHKRQSIIEYEARFGVAIAIDADDSVGGNHFNVERGEPVENPVKIESLMAFKVEPEEDDDIPFIEDEDEAEEDVKAEAETSEARSDDQGNGRKRKRRRRRRGRGNREGAEASQDGDQSDNGDDDNDGDDDDSTDTQASEGTEASADEAGEDKGNRKRRRRGKRGGRRNRDGLDANEQAAADVEGHDGASDDGDEATEQTEEAIADLSAEPEAAAIEPVAEAPKAEAEAEPVQETPVVEEVAAATEPQPVEENAAEEETASDDGEDKPVRANRGSNLAVSEPVVTSAKPTQDSEQPAPTKKGGWWQRRGFL